MWSFRSDANADKNIGLDMKTHTSTTPDNEKDFAQTPWWLVFSLESFMGENFDLDVCAMKETAKCNNYYSLEEGADSLKLGWHKFNFCNPPFTNIQAFMEKAVEEAKEGGSTCLIYPDNTETAYSRFAWQHADTIIRMPFRLGFIRPDGTPFLDKKGKKQGPQFPCAVALFTKIGLVAPTRVIYHDFRIGFEPN